VSKARPFDLRTGSFMRLQRSMVLLRVEKFEGETEKLIKESPGSLKAFTSRD